MNSLPYQPDTLFESSIRLSLWVFPIAATARIGIVTAVIQKPSIAGHELLPAICPRCTGKIRLPAPKNIPNSVLATTMVSFIVSFLFITMLAPFKIAAMPPFAAYCNAFI